MTALNVTTGCQTSATQAGSTVRLSATNCWSRAMAEARSASTRTSSGRHKMNSSKKTNKSKNSARELPLSSGMRTETPMNHSLNYTEKSSRKWNEPSNSSTNRGWRRISVLRRHCRLIRERFRLQMKMFSALVARRCMTLPSIQKTKSKRYPSVHLVR